MSVESGLERNDRKSWLRTVWIGLVPLQDIFEEDDFQNEDLTDQWDDVCTAMAWITEELGLDSSDPDIHGY